MQLLEFSVREGWEPLCKFLEVPVPDVPFPRVNSSADFQKQFLIVTTMGWVVMGFTVAAGAVTAWGSLRVLGKRAMLTVVGVELCTLGLCIKKTLDSGVVKRKAA